MSLPEKEVLVDEDGALVYLVPGLLSEVETNELFHQLKELRYERAVDDFGPQERLSAYVGEPECTFSYVGLVCKPEPWPDCMNFVREKVDTLISAQYNTKCTGCLINNYRRGEGSIVYHSDEVRAHGDAKLVISVSTGGERCFYLRNREDNSRIIRTRLPVGSALVMSGRTQELWEHALPLEPDAPHRISLTFRSIVPGYENGREPPHVV